MNTYTPEEAIVAHIRACGPTDWPELELECRMQCVPDMQDSHPAFDAIVHLLQEGVLESEDHDVDGLVVLEPYTSYSLTGKSMGLFVIEGLGTQKWVGGFSEADCRRLLWASLSTHERNAVVQMECIEFINLNDHA